jgi:hypothetical protein
MKVVSNITLFAATLLFVSAAAASAEPSCRTTMGAKKAAALVRVCRLMSPATHPPCNAANSCGLIIDEIKRGCAFDDYKNAACKPYREAAPQPVQP